MPAPAPAPDSTRERLLAEARALFAERGFYGVSIAQIAAELGITKQALLHHFGSKERLYAQVLARIADEFAALPRPAAPEGRPGQALATHLVTLLADTPAKVERARLLMRELLDNRHRAETAGAWLLKPFLADLSAMLSAVPGWSRATDAERMAALLPWLGAVSYHAVSQPTFKAILGAPAHLAMEAAFAPALQAALEAALAAGPTVPARTPARTSARAAERGSTTTRPAAAPSAPTRRSPRSPSRPGKP